MGPVCPSVLWLCFLWFYCSTIPMWPPQQNTVVKPCKLCWGLNIEWSSLTTALILVTCSRAAPIENIKCLLHSKSSISIELLLCPGDHSVVPLNATSTSMQCHFKIWFGTSWTSRIPQQKSGVDGYYEQQCIFRVCVMFSLALWMASVYCE